MIIIGLCGGSGSGKTLVSQMIMSLGIPVFESDIVYHRLIQAPSDCVRELVAEFGTAIQNRQGGINRRALSRLVFSDRPDAQENLRRLNEITHRHVCNAFLSWKDEQIKCGATAIVLEAPLLFESGMDRLCTVKIAVTAPRNLRIARITARDRISVKEASARLDAQRSDMELSCLCDYTIENTGTMKDVRVSVEKLINNILNQRI